MGNTPDMQMVKSPLLATPPEILVLIAESVANVSTAPYKISLYQPSDNSTLANFSLANKAIRRACISAGLFSNCTLPAHKVEPSLDRDAWFETGPLRIISLGIDLGNPNVWDSCAHIMTAFPDLDELVLSGSFPKRLTPAFFKSELATTFRSFKGTSVVLRKAPLTYTQSEISSLIGGSNVTAFRCLDSDLDRWTGVFLKLESLMITLPSNRRKNFFGVNALLKHILAPMGIYSEVRPQLRRFEWTFGSKVRLRKDRTKALTAGSPRFVKNWSYYRDMAQMLLELQLQTYKSLEVFVDGDSLGGDMVDIINALVSVQQVRRYEKLKLLVFRCDCPQVLTIGTGTPSDIEGEYPIWKHVSSPLSIPKFSPVDIHNVRLFLVLRLHIR
jgi:hypothetical protein